jgi:hypothetical protein
LRNGRVDMGKKGGFYIGRDYDAQSGETTSQATHYDPDDLTTHAVVVGMTGLVRLACVWM